MPDLTQPIDLREAVSIQKRIVLLRKITARLIDRAGGAQLDEVEDCLDDALQSISFADDAMQRALDDPKGLAA